LSRTSPERGVTCGGGAKREDGKSRGMPNLGNGMRGGSPTKKSGGNVLVLDDRKGGGGVRPPKKRILPAA